MSSNPSGTSQMIYYRIVQSEVYSVHGPLNSTLFPTPSDWFRFSCTQLRHLTSMCNMVWTISGSQYLVLLTTVWSSQYKELNHNCLVRQALWIDIHRSGSSSHVLRVFRVNKQGNLQQALEDSDTPLYWPSTLVTLSPSLSSVAAGSSCMLLAPVPGSVASHSADPCFVYKLGSRNADIDTLRSGISVSLLLWPL